MTDEWQAESLPQGWRWRFVRWLRWLECRLPPQILAVLLWPGAAAAAAWAIVREPCSIACFDQLPLALRGKAARSTWPWMVWRWRTWANLQVFLRLWPDRLRAPRWQRRCRWLGRKHLEQCLAEGRPVILAFPHFGPVQILTYWLRAQGLAAAILVQPPVHRGPFRRHLVRLADEANGLKDVPVILSTGEIRRLRQFLKPCRLLLMAVDVSRGRQVTIHGEGFSFRMATGPVRLARRLKAALLPCVTRADGLFRYTIQLGAPVPAEWIADEKQCLAACEHLAQTFVPTLRHDPEQYWSTQLRHFEGANQE